MKIKVNFFSKDLGNEFLSFISIISLILSFVLIVVEIPDDYKLLVGIVIVALFFLLYVSLWIKANRKTSEELSINNSKIHVQLGDLFKSEDLKVIAFNEYFDTQVDDVIISSNSLNGIFIKNHVDNLTKFNSLLDSNIVLAGKCLSIDNQRSGKQKKYKLGTIYKYNDFLLFAFTKFDNNNRAYLSITDYIECMVNFWNELDIVYNGMSISIPLIGSGITRFKECIISEQELLDLLIFTFKISRIKIKYPSKINIIISENMKDKINFYKLKYNN